MNWTSGEESLTDLSGLLPRIDEAATAAAREGAAALALLIVELPALGRLALDSSYELTAAAVERLERAVVRSGSVAVVGEGLLAVLAPRTGPRMAAALARRIEHCLELPPAGGSLPDGRVTVRIHELDPRTSAREALAQAGVALAAGRRHRELPARKTGTAVPDARPSRTALGDDLAEAVRAGRIGVVYQPIIGLQSGKIIGTEVLARWQHPSLGAIPPLDFVPLAHEIGAAGELGRLVLETALTQLGRWRNARQIDPGFILSVNASADQLRSLVDSGHVQDLLASTGADPGSLALELTEESFVTGAEHDARVFEQLRALGVGLHIDDFGTGYSSIGYLRRLPAALVKIDRTLLGDVAGDPREQRFIRAILDMVDALELGAVFEGVETPGQARGLSRLGASMGQGFHFSRPLAAPAMTALLADWGRE